MAGAAISLVLPSIAVLGPGRVLAAGRLGFDYGCLLASLRATGAQPQPSLVLLAYAFPGA